MTDTSRYFTKKEYEAYLTIPMLATSIVGELPAIVMEQLLNAFEGDVYAHTVRRVTSDITNNVFDEECLMITVKTADKAQGLEKLTSVLDFLSFAVDMDRANVITYTDFDNTSYRMIIGSDYL